jgi:hypothetical protein
MIDMMNNDPSYTKDYYNISFKIKDGKIGLPKNKK